MKRLDDNDRLRAGTLPHDPEEGAVPISREPASAAVAGALGSLVVVRLSEVPPEPVTWLWQGRIPLGKITMVDGDPNVGKSTMVADLVARLTTGRAFPGETAEHAPAAAIYVAHEDGYGDTLRPRLNAAGADAGKVYAFDGFVDAGALRIPAIPADVVAIEASIVERSAKLLIIDPLNAYVPGVDVYKDHEVRRALAPLANMAERTGVAVVLIRHMGKTAGRAAMYRGLGSIGIIGLARSALLLAKDPNDENMRILASVKSNLGPPPPSLAWRFTGGDPPSIDWIGASAHTADQLVNVPPEGGEERSALDEAAGLLADLVEAGGGYVKVADAKKQAHAAGIADRTLQRARQHLGLKPRRLTFGGDYVWERSTPLLASNETLASKENDESQPAQNPLDSGKNRHLSHGRQHHARQTSMTSMVGDPLEERNEPGTLASFLRGGRSP